MSPPECAFEAVPQSANMFFGISTAKWLSFCSGRKCARNGERRSSFAKRIGERQRRSVDDCSRKQGASFGGTNDPPGAERQGIHSARSSDHGWNNDRIPQPGSVLSRCLFHISRQAV